MSKNLECEARRSAEADTHWCREYSIHHIYVAVIDYIYTAVALIEDQHQAAPLKTPSLSRECLASPT
jgi:hypothetical protein